MKKHKITLGLLITLAFIVFASPTYTNADDAKCNKFVDEHVKNFADKYGIKLDSEKTETENNVILSMKIPQDSDLSAKDKKAAEFKITKIEIGGVADEKKGHIQQTFTTEQIGQAFGITKTTIKDGDTIVFPHPYDTAKGYHITLEPINNYKDAALISNCGDIAIFTIEVSADIYEQPKISMSDKVSQLFNNMDISPITGQKFDCNTMSNFAENSFEYNYCTVYNKAKENNSDANKTLFNVNWESGFDAKDIKAFKCDINKIVKSQDVLNDDSQYYVEENRKYMAATSEKQINVGEYVYNYAYSSSDNKKVVVQEKVPITCKKACTEAIKVEYGAPVASKAGLCFEYKVKVTSYVKCDLIEEPAQPDKNKYKVCTPVPGCNHGSGYNDTAAGPNSEFKACVDKCDGGEFTKKCSTKCYKEVYLNNSNNKKTALLDSIEVLATKTANKKDEKKKKDEEAEKQEKADVMQNVDEGNETQEHDFQHIGEGKYYVNNKGRIIWKPATHLGRYYLETKDREEEWKKYKCAKKSGQGGGILADCGCAADCYWKGCTNKEGKVSQYINPDDSEADAEINMETYKKARELCKNETTCSTTAAEFEISVDYKYGEKAEQKKTISFPYTKNDKDNKNSIKLTNDGKGKVTCDNPGGSKNTTLIESQGCYANSNCTMKERDGGYKANDINNYYMTEWTFPGTWQHVKTGEITYEKPEQSEIDNKVWIEKGNKYCIPLDQVEVNKIWWDKYYAALTTNANGTQNLEYSITDTNYIENISGCASTNNGENAVPTNTTIKDSDIDYNIHAATNSFGYFHWNINVDCFYAVGKVPTTPSTETKDKDGNTISCLSPSKEQMKIRTVDLGNLFPGTGEETLSNPTETGRTPGFNWSTFAEPKFIETGTDTEQTYSSQIHPKDYLNYVQKNKYTIYNDDELDYDISLSKDQINQLRSLVKDNNYTKYEGSSTTDSASHYISDLWDKGLVTAHKHPTGSALKCNNLKNGSCFDVSKDS